MLRRLTLIAAVALPLLHGFSISQSALQPAPDAQKATVAPVGNAAIDDYNKANILVTRSLMSPKNVADTFGRRIGRRYIALQITVANRNSQYQWLITDASVNLSEIIGYMQHSCAPRAQSLIALTNKTLTSADLTVLRGVAEKGQTYDPRNLTVRILEGSGTIAAGLLGITTFGPALAPSIAAFNGPLINSVQRIFPDETINQINRLNDSAYGANLLVPKQQSRVMVIFIPMATLLSKAEQAKFNKDPYSVYNSCTDLRLLDATVNGHFIAQLDLVPSITNVEISPNEVAKFGIDNFKVAGAINGRNLDKAKIDLSGAPVGLTIKETGTSSEKIYFELSSPQPLPPNLPITFLLRKDGSPTLSWSVAAAWVPQRPAITGAGLTPASLKQGEQKTFEIDGSGFLLDSRLELDNRKGLTIGDLTYVNTGKLKVTIAAAEDAALGPREIEVHTAGGVSGKAVLTISAKQ